ncbi:MAG: hypothetical protein ACP5QO_00415 [Clostridia bacterium]
MGMCTKPADDVGSKVTPLGAPAVPVVPLSEDDMMAVRRRSTHEALPELTEFPLRQWD